MKKVICFSAFILFSCTSDKIYRKQLHDEAINLNWYYYSYISSKSPDYISVTKNEKEALIFKGDYGLQDIELKKDTILILHLKFGSLPEIQKQNIYGYTIKYKEVSSHDMYIKYLENKKKLK